MARSNKDSVLTINGGSSSIKFALYTIRAPLTPFFSGEVENIGTQTCKLNFTKAGSDEKNVIPIKGGDYQQVVSVLMDWLEKQDAFDHVKAVGHRLVHGMSHTKPEKITPALLHSLKEISAYDPEHLPDEIKLIEMFSKRYALLDQVACFDTSFHADMPPVAKLLPIPRRFDQAGIRRYGFHGLSYAYLIEELERIAGEEAAKGKVIIAHLGSGASLAAVKHGKSLDTSMGGYTNDIDPSSPI